MFLLTIYQTYSKETDHKILFSNLTWPISLPYSQFSILEANSSSDDSNIAAYTTKNASSHHLNQVEHSALSSSRLPSNTLVHPPIK